VSLVDKKFTVRHGLEGTGLRDGLRISNMSRYTKML
jgi:hypothetical protein